MKKTLALVLAALMTAGMTTVAFAASLNTEVVLAYDDEKALYVDGNDNGRFAETDDKFNNGTTEVGLGAIEIPAVEAPYNKVVSVDLSVVKGGKKVAIPLLDKDGEQIKDKDLVKGYKVKTEWSVGGLDDKAKIEQVKVGTNYVYAITFVMPEAPDTKTADLAGEISVYKNSSDLKDSNAEKPFITLSFGSTYGYKVEALGDLDNDVSDAEVVEFKKTKGGDKLEGEETLVAGNFEFEVDVTGQGKLNLKNNVDFNKEFAAMYDYANIDFVTFEKAPSFNKNGQVWIYADEDAFIYEVTEDGAKEIKGLKWDEDYEAWTFKTRTLKAYAISDVELDEKTATEDKDDASSTTDGGKKNPDTGR